MRPPAAGPENNEDIEENEQLHKDIFVRGPRSAVSCGLATPVVGAGASRRHKKTPGSKDPGATI
jgi:hypothetical protein